MPTAYAEYSVNDFKSWFSISILNNRKNNKNYDPLFTSAAVAISTRFANSDLSTYCLRWFIIFWNRYFGNGLFLQLLWRQIDKGSL